MEEELGLMRFRLKRMERRLRDRKAFSWHAPNLVWRVIVLSHGRRAGFDKVEIEENGAEVEG